jgi:hypothetical protein
MGLFKSNHLTGWSHDDDGVAVFFKKHSDYERASKNGSSAKFVGELRLR